MLVHLNQRSELVYQNKHLCSISSFDWQVGEPMRPLCLTLALLCPAPSAVTEVGGVTSGLVLVVLQCLTVFSQMLCWRLGFFWFFSSSVTSSCDVPVS